MSGKSLSDLNLKYKKTRTQTKEGKLMVLKVVSFVGGLLHSIHFGGLFLLGRCIRFSYVVVHIKFSVTAQHRCIATMVVVHSLDSPKQ